MDARDLRPMLATAGSVGSLSDGPWAYEFKWDGARAIVQRTDVGIRIFSRRGSDVTDSFPELGGLADVLPLGAILDGEVVAFDAERRPSFQVLQRRLNVRATARVRQAMVEVPIALMAFDLLHDGHTAILAAPYTERRAMLEGLALAAPAWQVPGRHDDLTTVLRVVGDLGLEGVVGKRPASPYRPGERSELWQKLRIKLEQEFVVAGYRAGQGGRGGGIGSLLLGVYGDAGDLVFCGAVGSGLTDSESEALQIHLDARRVPESPFAAPGAPADAVFVEPDLVVQVRFAEWTDEGLLRQPTYRGRRSDKLVEDVVRET